MSVDGKMPAGTWPREKAKKRKKPAKQNYSAQCDVLFGRIVRAPGRCCICGSTEAVQCAHGFSRRYRPTRWDIRNAFPLCRAHHMYYTHHPLEWDDWLRAKWGQFRYDDIRFHALNGGRPDLKATLALLRAIERQVA